MSVKRYDIEAYSYFEAASWTLVESEVGDFVYASDYDELRERYNALVEALQEICDYDSYKHPDESFIALRDAAIKESNECTACQYAKTAKWPPSGLCNEHYRTVTRAEDKVKQMFKYKQTWEPRVIARRALEEK